MPQRTYDPKAVTAAFGEVLLSGFAEGTFIKASRDKDRFTKKVGARGEVTRIKVNDRSGRVEVTLDQSSPVNDYLQAIALQDEAANAGVRSFSIVDHLGTTYVHAENSWIVKDPDVEEGTDLTTRTWIFDLAEMIKFVGGSFAT